MLATIVPRRVLGIQDKAAESYNRAIENLFLGGY